MERKIYKIDVQDLFSLSNFGFKKDWNSPAHINNIFRLDDVYKIRYPMLMEQVAKLEYINFRCKENKTIPKREKTLFNVPDYFLVSEVEPNGYFEYTELLTNITFLIPSEIHDKLYGRINNLKQEINVYELRELFSIDYITKIANLFNLTYDNEKKQTKQEQIIKKINSN